MNYCTLCRETIILIDKDSYSRLTNKSLESCNNVRIFHGQPSLEFDQNTILYVHTSCRKRFANSILGITNQERKRKDNASSGVCSSSSVVNDNHQSENIRSKDLDILG